MDTRNTADRADRQKTIQAFGRIEALNRWWAWMVQKHCAIRSKPRSYSDHIWPQRRDTRRVFWASRKRRTYVKAEQRAGGAS